MRDFAPADQDAVRNLVLAGRAERWGEAFDPALNEDLDDVASNYLAIGADIVVVEVAGRIVATGTLIPEADGAGRIVRMSVDRAHRWDGFPAVQSPENPALPGASLVGDTGLEPVTSAV